ncbi:hypothetical protein J4479_03995 [Candidatus Woesearchaeota archaeon]|nr:hypothetical protein [Candidatus Woesearchaeota archaeon]
MVFNFNAKLISKENLTSDALLLSFKSPDEFFFKAGQFVTLILKAGNAQKPRSYSILNPPSERGKLDLGVKLVDGGFASEIFRNLKAGDEIAVKGPFGHFVFDDKTGNDHWFIGAGTGIAPLYSMIKEHLLHHPAKKFRLIMGYKTASDLLFHEELLSFKARYNNFEYIPVLSRSAWNGRKGHAQDHLGEDLQNKTFYICGLKELVLETKELLLNKGVDPQNIKFERYN